jgi:hypothetical protein
MHPVTKFFRFCNPKKIHKNPTYLQLVDDRNQRLHATVHERHFYSICGVLMIDNIQMFIGGQVSYLQMTQVIEYEFWEQR